MNNTDLATRIRNFVIRDSGDAWLVFSHELRDLLKERTIIFLTIVLPVIIYPLLFGGMNTLISEQVSRLRGETLHITCTGFPDGNAFIDTLRKRHQQLQDKLVPSPAEALVDKTLDFWLEYLPPEGHDDDGLVLLHFSGANHQARAFLQTLLETVRLSIWELPAIRSLMSEADFDPDRLVTAMVIDVSSDREKGAYYAGKIIPLLMILMILSGASFAAVDIIAGEKERGTLETLLLAPVARSSIVWGKFFIITLIAIVSSLLNLAGVYLTIWLGLFRMPMQHVTLSLGLLEVTMLFLFTLPMAFFFSSILMIIAGWAETFKEGQYYVMPVVLLSMVPGFVVVLPGFSLDSILCVVPIASLALAMKEVISGTMNTGPLLIAFVVNLFYAGIALRFATRMLDRETIIQPARPVISAATDKSMVRQVGILFGCCFLLLYYLGTLVQSWDVIAGLWITQIFFIAVPAFIFVWWCREKPIPFMRLKGFSLPHFFGAIGAECVIFCGAIVVSIIQDMFLPAPKGFGEEFGKVFLDTGYPMWANVLTFGLSAGICEELLFRGSIFRGLTKSIKPWQAILVSGILFGLFHFNIYRLLPTAFIGICYGWICWKTDSLPMTMILHALHNMTAISIMAYTPDLYSHFQQILSGWQGWLMIAVIAMSSWYLLDRPTQKGDTRQ